nr:PadR family transcriptional regulator [Micromonospora tarapacensis]
MHGYAIIGEVAALSDGRLSLRPGTLYGALDRLTDAGLVELDREETVDGRLRRYYRLSPGGDATLTAETERLRRNVEAASARLRARSARRLAPVPPRAWHDRAGAPLPATAAGVPGRLPPRPG